MGIVERITQSTRAALAGAVAAGMRIPLGAGAVTVLIIGLSPVTPASESPSGEVKIKVIDPLERVREKASQVEVLKAHITMKNFTTGEEMKTEGELVFKAPEGFRMDTSVDGMPDGNMTLISDGKTMWMLMAGAPKVMRFDVERLTNELGDQFGALKGIGRGQEAPDFIEPFDGLREESIRYRGTETVDGVECYTFEGEVAREPADIDRIMDQPIPQKTILWLGKEDGVCRKEVVVDEEGNPMMEMTVSDIELNPELEEGFFQYTPGPDEEVVDLTELTIKFSETGDERFRGRAGFRR